MEIVMLWLSLIKSNFRVRSRRRLNARVDAFARRYSEDVILPKRAASAEPAG